MGLSLKERLRRLEAESTALHAELEHTQLELKRAQTDAFWALDLVSRIRFALGDNGWRMQDELIEYCKELANLCRESTGPK